MLEAIVHAQLGDDVLREDPTVMALEDLAAEKMGKENALLVTSGTQANLVSLMAQTQRGDEVILESDSHIYYYEVGGLSAIAGLVPRTLKGHRGVLDPHNIEAAIRPADIHQPRTALICIENTHNRAGGTVVKPKQIESINEVAKEHEIGLYMDGARVFNAAVALEVDPKQLTRHVDNLMFCLSKGLSAPVGSLVVGSHDFIEKARRIRKMLGGGMRQAGVIAAPGIVALEKMVDRLRDDHDNARHLAEGLARIDRISIDLPSVQTNIVIFDVGGLNMTGSQFVAQLERRGVKSLDYGGTLVRMVTHRGIEREDVDRALEAVKQIAEESD